MKPRLFLAAALALLLGLPLAAHAQAPKLTDLDKDGDPDMLETVWNGKKVIWIDDNDNMKWTATRGDEFGDCVMIDRDGDGKVDGPDDMAVKWADEDGDGDPDWQFIAIEANTPGKRQDPHWMVFQDVDDDNILSYIDWKTFELKCWEHDAPAQFKPDYNGGGIFLKAHFPASKFKDPSLNWENPFAFYDMDGDGWTEMAVRLLDEAGASAASTGNINEGYVSYDIDGDAGPANGMDFDFTLRFVGCTWDYTKFVHKIPAMRGLPETDDMFPAYKNWRTLTELKFVPHEQCYAELFSKPWTRCYFTFDEDDDDHRWERVELYYPTAMKNFAAVNDPWSLVRRDHGKDQRSGGLSWHAQSDSIGDRGEFDCDNSGKGQPYFSPLDAKLHLYGAEWGGWLTDDGTFHGGWMEPTDRKVADKLKGVVIYKDTDNNGFIDTIQCDWNADKKFEAEYSVTEFKGADVAPVWNSAELKYQGIKKNLDAAVNEHWQGLVALYVACEKAGVGGIQAEEAYRLENQSQRLMHAWDLRLKAGAAIRKHIDGNARMSADQKKELAGKIDKALLLGQCDEAAKLVGEM